MFDILILNNCSCNKPIMLHCLWYIRCLYISYVHYSYPSFISPFLPFPSYPASPLLLPFICLVTVTCLRLFSRIFGSNDRHIFFGPSVEHKFPASSIDHYVYYTFCLFFLCLSKTIGRFQFWDCLLLNHSDLTCDWLHSAQCHCFFDSLTSRYFQTFICIRKKGTWAKRTCMYGVIRFFSYPLLLSLRERKVCSQSLVLFQKVSADLSCDQVFISS